MNYLIHLKPNIFHINLADLIFLGIIVTALNFALLLLFTKRADRSANTFLALALIVMIFLLLRVWATDVRLPLQCSLALGPLIFFYVLKITRPDYNFRRKDLLHFIPMFLEEFISTSPVVPFLTFISVITYLYFSHKLTERFYRRLKFDRGDRYRCELRWLQKLLTGFGLLWLLWLPLSILIYYHQFGGQAYYLFYLCLAGMLISIAITAYLKPEIGALINTVQVIKPPLPTDLKQKGTWLKKIIKENRYYQDPELSLGLLAEKLGLHTHELSRILNIALKKSFNDFINEYRVVEVVQKMQHPAFDHITLLGIAYDSGFNSESTFHRVFKEVTGKTPARYKKELPTYNLPVGLRLATIISNYETTPKWSFEKLNRSIMFRNYFKIAWRNLVRQKLFSLINISGLAVGLSVCMLIMIYVAHEHSYDRFHKNADRIFKTYGQMKVPGEATAFNFDQMSYISGPIIKQSLPIVEDYIRTLNYFGPVVVVNNPKLPERKFIEDKLLFADAGFFNFFSFKLLSGQPAQVLSKPFSVVLSKDMANKYFGDENPVGKTLTMKTDSAYTYLVTGVAENCPSNSSIEYNFVASNSGFVTTKGGKDYLGTQTLGGGAFDTYLLLRHRSDTAALTAGFRSLNIHKDHEFETNCSFLPLIDRHLKRSVNDANLTYLSIFPLVALLILLLALVKLYEFIYSKGHITGKRDRYTKNIRRQSQKHRAAILY